MVDPVRDPTLEPVNDPARPVYPGEIERDVADPARPLDPRADPRVDGPRAAGSRGLAGATIAVVLVILGVLAFSFFGAGTRDEAVAPTSGQPAVEGTENPPTSSVTPNGEQALPPIAPNNPVEPVQPAPAPAPAN